jgi:hypothetical protein
MYIKISCDFFLIAMKPKIHHSNHFSHGPPTTSGGPKLTDLREQLGEERNVNRITPIAPMAAPMAPIVHQGWLLLVKGWIIK